MTAAARRLALIGDPVDHSLSPAMHAAGFAALGLDAEYLLERVSGRETAAVGDAMRRYARTGGGNVTIPHKTRAARALDEMSAAVRDTGACNCFWQADDGGLAGDNTDVVGISDVLAELLGDRPPDDVLVIGAGGAAAAAAVAAGRLGAGAVRIANRTHGRASRLAKRLLELGIVARTEPWPVTGACDVIVNATPLGLSRDDPAPASFDRVEARLVLDLVYDRMPPARAGEPGTRWSREAAERGIPARDGLEVLVRQAAACYPRWFGVEVPLAALRHGVRIAVA